MGIVRIKTRISFRVSILFFTLFFSGICSFGQNSLTAQQVIDRFIEVSGGKKYLSGLKVTSATAKGVANGDSVVITVIKVAPYKIYMKYVTAHNGVFEIALNKEKAIIKKDGQRIPISDSSHIDDLKAQSFVLTDMAYEKLGYSMDLVPSEDDSTYKIKLVSPKGNTAVKYYSKNTGYLTKITFAEGVSSYFSNYSKIEGFTLSQKERTITQEGAIEDVYITEFVINPKYDPGIFDF